jgi:hypothetical protein
VCRRSIGARAFQQRLKLVNDGGSLLDSARFRGRGFVARRNCHFGSTCVGATALSGSVALLFVILSAAEESAVPRTFPGNAFGTRLAHNCHPAIVTATYVSCRKERRMVCASATRLHGVRGQTELALHETTRPRNRRESIRDPSEASPRVSTRTAPRLRSSHLLRA